MLEASVHKYSLRPPSSVQRLLKISALQLSSLYALRGHVTGLQIISRKYPLEWRLIHFYTLCRLYYANQGTGRSKACGSYIGSLWQHTPLKASKDFPASLSDSRNEHKGSPDKTEHPGEDFEAGLTTRTLQNGAIYRIGRQAANCSNKEDNTRAKSKFRQRRDLHN